MTPDSGRRPYISGNWKMFKTSADARSYVKELRKVLPAEPAADVGICVPFTALAAAMKAAEGSDIRVCAQNMHHEAEGAFTGEISAPMLLEYGIHGVVLGHSERRTVDDRTGSRPDDGWSRSVDDEVGACARLREQIICREPDSHCSGIGAWQNGTQRHTVQLSHTIGVGHCQSNRRAVQQEFQCSSGDAGGSRRQRRRQFYASTESAGHRCRHEARVQPVDSDIEAS